MPKTIRLVQNFLHSPKLSILCYSPHIPKSPDSSKITQAPLNRPKLSESCIPFGTVLQTLPHSSTYTHEEFALRGTRQSKRLHFPRVRFVMEEGFDYFGPALYDVLPCDLCHCLCLVLKME
ncbi:hypothetical protein J6590_045617 [Homalodisca vitripennis]|nr:hypothetical protein J6590_045617 [Homalodisca vitripennis]